MITRLYELLTGQPWTTTRTMATEYGPPPAVQYARQLAGYSDLELIRNGPEILAQIRRNSHPHDHTPVHDPDPPHLDATREQVSVP